MFVSQISKPSKSPYLQPLYFFWWWYTKALLQVISFLIFLLASAEDQFSILVMLKAILTLQPMHQDFSIIGRAIGVVIRILWIALGLVAFAATLAISLVILAIWLGLPAALVYGLWETIF